MFDPLAVNGIVHSDVRGWVPLGGLIVWPVANTMPAGWQRCDGTNGSLDTSAIDPSEALCYIQRMA